MKYHFQSSGGAADASQGWSERKESLEKLLGENGNE